MFTIRKYDFIFGLGTDCACTSYLRLCKLQNMSYPFDWLTNAGFETSMDLFVNDFKDFFNIEDFVPLPKNDSENDQHYDCDENDFYTSVRSNLKSFNLC